MSRFSDYLRRLIDKSDETISSISRCIGAERTSIHKALSDERILPYKVVQELAGHFNLPLDERQEFFRLYDILLQGEENYRNRQAVAKLLNNLSTIQYQMVPPPIVPEIKVNDQLIKGEYAVRSAIRSILIYETTHITEGEFYLYCPSALDLTSELMGLWLDGREFSVSQLFCLSDEGKESFEIQNLLLLQSIIPLCLASRGRYRPYYFCEIPGSSMITPLSCYIITPGYLIQFAEDLSTAQICRESELVEYFRNYFMSLTLRCEPLTRCSTDIRDTLNELITGTSADAMCILMDQPCPGRYFTSDIIAKYMNSSNLPYEQMFDLVNSRFSVLRNMKGEYCTIFTEKGLKEFAQSGVMSDIPQEFVTSLERSDVRMLLIKLREEIEKGSVRGLITRPMYLRLPDYLVFYADANTGIHVYTNNAFVFGAYCCNIHISEKSICRVFLDFVQSLPGSQLVYSREDVLKILEQQIEAIT